MSRIGYDSVTPVRCPANGQVYPGYVDGKWPTLAEMKARFPGKRYPSITVNGTHDALCADIENGDFSVNGGARWAKDHLAHAPYAWLYCSISNLPAVQHAVAGLGIAPHVRFWVAHYDREAVIPQGTIGKQYLGDFNGYDQSIFADHIAGLDPDILPPGWYVRQLEFPALSNAGITRRVAVAGHGVVPLQIGKDVMVVQRKVGAHVDGLYGPGTKAMVGDYQGSHGLVRDGVVGPKTAIRLGP